MISFHPKHQMTDNNITVTDKTTKTATTVTGQEVSLTARSVVQLPVPHNQVKSLARSGSDLVITTADGQTVTVHGFFADGPGHNNLVFQDQDGLWWSNLSGFDTLPGDGSVDPSAGGVFSAIDSIDPLFSNDVPLAASNDVPLAASDVADAVGSSDGMSGDLLGNLDWLPAAVALASFSTAAESNPTQSGGLSIGPNVAQNLNGTLSVSGKVGPGDTVTVTYPDNSANSGTADANGYYTVTSKGVQTTGQVSVTDTGVSGSSSTMAQQWSDHTPPQAPGISAVTANADGTVTVSGKAEAGSTVTVTYADNITTATAQADANGSYSVLINAPQAGPVAVTATDVAGNASAATVVALITQSSTANSDGTLTVAGTAAPNSDITVTFADGGTATGVADSHGIYSVQSGSAESGAVTVLAANPLPQAAVVGAVTANADGTLTVAGAAVPGSTVTVTFADGSQATGTADTNGNYSVRSNTPETSGGALNVSYADALGNASAPAAAIPVTQNSSTPNSDGTLTVSGTAAPGSIIAVNYADGSKATGRTGADGNYSVQSSARESSAVTVTATNLLPHPPTIDVVSAHSDGTVTVSGLAAPESAVTVTYADGSTASGTAGSDGSFSVVSGASGAANGPVSAIVSYPAANTASGSTAITPVTGSSAPGAGGILTVSGTAMPGSAITVTFADGSTATGTTGSNGSYTVFSNTPETSAVSVTAVNPPPPAPTVNGLMASADGTLFVWGTTVPYGAVTVTYSDGHTSIVTAGSNGSYTAHSSAAETGAVNVTAADALGKVSPPTIAVPPTGAATANTDNTLTVAGTAAPDSYIIVTFADGSTVSAFAGADGHYSVQSTTAETGPVSVAMIVTIAPPQAPVISTISNSTDHILTVTGTAAPNSTVTVTFPDNSTATATADGNGNYSVHSQAAQTATGSISVVDTDWSGNHSPATIQSWSEPVIAAAISSVAENQDGTITVTGTAAPDSAFTVTFPDGSTVTGTASASGSYSVQSSVIEPGGTVHVTATDPAGTASTATPVNYMPLQGPATITAIDQHTVDGASGYATNAQALSFSGALAQPLAANQSVQISTDGGGTWHTAITDASGTAWSYDNTANPLPDGNYTVAAHVVDAAQNPVGSVSTQLVTVDTAAPTETVAIAAINPDTGASSADFVTGSGSLTFSGTLSGGPLANGSQPGVSAESVQVSLDGGQSWHAASVAADTGGPLHWSLDNTANTLPDGIYMVQAHVADAAGNTGPLAVQQVEISASGTLNLSLQDVLNDANILTSAGSTQQVTVDNGGVVSTVTLAEGVGTGANQWQDTGATTVNGITYDIYHNAAQGASTLADLLIQHGIAVS
jgi:hypothetical protein